jgi:hypothetical protein
MSDDHPLANFEWFHDETLPSSDFEIITYSNYDRSRPPQWAMGVIDTLSFRGEVTLPSVDEFSQLPHLVSSARMKDILLDGCSEHFYKIVISLWLKQNDEEYAAWWNEVQPVKIFYIHAQRTDNQVSLEYYKNPGALFYREGSIELRMNRSPLVVALEDGGSFMAVACLEPPNRPFKTPRYVLSLANDIRRGQGQEPEVFCWSLCTKNP